MAARHWAFRRHSNTRGLTATPATCVIYATGHRCRCSLRSSRAALDPSQSAFNGEKLLDTYALAIGDAFQAHELSPFEWAHFAHACALPFRQLSTELSRMAGRVHEALPKACDDARRAGVELAQIEQIQGLIAAECERQAEMAPAVAKVDPSLY